MDADAWFLLQLSKYPQVVLKLHVRLLRGSARRCWDLTCTTSGAGLGTSSAKMCGCSAARNASAAAYACRIGERKWARPASVPEAAVKRGRTAGGKPGPPAGITWKRGKASSHSISSRDTRMHALITTSAASPSCMRTAPSSVTTFLLRTLRLQVLRICYTNSRTSAHTQPITMAGGYLSCCFR